MVFFKKKYFLKYLYKITENATFVRWEHITARLIRPDLRCQNGIVHVIDEVIVRRREIAVTDLPSSANTFFLQKLFIFPFILTLYLKDF